MLSEAEEAWIEELLVATDEHPRLSPWERGFMADQRDSFETYGPEMLVSPKMWGVMRRIADKVGHSVGDVGDGA